MLEESVTVSLSSKCTLIINRNIRKRDKFFDGGEAVKGLDTQHIVWIASFELIPFVNSFTEVIKQIFEDLWHEIKT
jgi:hypothetical protein